MSTWRDGWWWSRDGVRLHFRDYPGDGARAPVICLGGLTRNARDFEALAPAITPGRRVICPELRGRGESGYAPDPMSYVPLTYLQDLEALIEAERIERFAVIGTSLGGILAMLLAATGAERITGAVLNDVGPRIEPSGMARIRNYVGRGPSCPTWLHSARATAETHAASFPDYQLSDWLRMTKRLNRLTPGGRITADYDPRIAEPFRLPNSEVGGDLWRALPALAGRPLLLIRGALSDVLSADTAAAMVEKLPDLRRIDMPRIGHAPTLDEPESRAAIAELLAQAA